MCSPVREGNPSNLRIGFFSNCYESSGEGNLADGQVQQGMNPSLSPCTPKVTGKVTGNKHLEHKGKFQNTSGVVRTAFVVLKEDVKKASQSEYLNLSVRLFELIRAR